MSHYCSGKIIRLAALRAVVLVSAVTLATLSLADSGSAAAKKVVGVTLLSLQSPFLVTVDNAMKAEAAKEVLIWFPLIPSKAWPWNSARSRISSTGKSI